jgi:hypothetical protein
LNYSKLLELENKEIIKRGALRPVRFNRSSKVAHKQIVPRVAKTWSLSKKDFILLRARDFFTLVERGL